MPEIWRSPYTVFTTAENHSIDRLVGVGGDRMVAAYRTTSSSSEPSGNGGTIDYFNQSLAFRLIDLFGSPFTASFAIETATVVSSSGGMVRSGSQLGGYDVVALADGSFIVAYELAGVNGGAPFDVPQPEIYFRRFASDGTAIGTAQSVNVNGVGPGVHAQVSITAFANGGFGAVWTDRQDKFGLIGAEGAGVFFQRFDSAGAAVGGKIKIDATTEETRILTLANGESLVIWDRNVAQFTAAGTSALVAQKISATGSLSGGVTTLFSDAVGTANVNYTIYDAIALKNGGFAIIASRSDTATFNVPVKLYLFDNAGASVGSSLTLLDGHSSTISLQKFDMVATDDGGLSIAATLSDPFTSTGGQSRIHVSSAGAITETTSFGVASLVDLITSSAAIGVFSDGREMVAWEVPTTPTTNSVSAEIFDARTAQTLNGTTGNDVLVGHALNSARANEIFVTGDGNDYAYGYGGNDYFYMGVGNDVAVAAGTGLNIFVLGDGDDQGYGAGGQDYVYGGAGADTIVGLDGNDVLLGENGNDIIYGGNGQDYIYGGEGDDTIVGEADADILIGEAGNDSINGGSGNDYIYGGLGSDIAYGGDGVDIIVVEAGDDTVYGEAGNDYLYLGDGNDTAYSGSGDDQVFGGVGNDTIDAGTGLDYVWGDSGNDTFLVNSGSGTLVIMDFAVGGLEDSIRLSADTGLTSFAQVQAAMSYIASSNTTLLHVDTNTVIWFVGININSFTAADFVFG